LLRNARQILNIVTATFSASIFEDHGDSLGCSSVDSDIERLGCDWRVISRQLKRLQQDAQFDAEPLLLALSKVVTTYIFRWVYSNASQWSKDAQEIMSSTASNYDIKKLVGGQIIAGFAFILALGVSMPTLVNSFISTAPFLLTTLAYGVMMFASSYVEEEQHFWYWVASGWLIILSLKGYVILLLLVITPC
jgi:ethanolaminephosphotransferase